MYYINDGVYGSFLGAYIAGTVLLPKRLEVSIFCLILMTPA